jgi:hypothetical protein
MDASREFALVRGLIVGGVYRATEPNYHFPRFNSELISRQDVVRPGTGHRHDGYSRLYGHSKNALLERL